MSKSLCESLGKYVSLFGWKQLEMRFLRESFWRMTLRPASSPPAEPPALREAAASSPPGRRQLAASSQPACRQISASVSASSD